MGNIDSVFILEVNSPEHREDSTRFVVQETEQKGLPAFVASTPGSEGLQAAEAVTIRIHGESPDQYCSIKWQKEEHEEHALTDNLGDHPGKELERRVTLVTNILQAIVKKRHINVLFHTIHLGNVDLNADAFSDAIHILTESGYTPTSSSERQAYSRLYICEENTEQ